MENDEEVTNSGDESGVDSGDEEVDELDMSEDERHKYDNDCFGMENMSRKDVSQVLDCWKKFKEG